MEEERGEEKDDGDVAVRQDFSDDGKSPEHKRTMRPGAKELGYVVAEDARKLFKARMAAE